MSETVWVALITGGFTLASGIVAVILTHRYSKAQAEATRREDRRRDARALIASLIEAGTQWASMNQTLVPAYYKASTDKDFWFEFPDTDTGKAIREHALTIGRTAGELRLIVSDDELLDRISVAQALMADGAAMQALLEEGKRTNGGKWEGDVMVNAFAHHRDVGNAFRAVESRAAELLRGAL